MELEEQNYATLSKYLMDTLNPDVNIRKPAEQFLEQVEINQNYPMLLLTLLTKQEVDITIRVACSVTFKNYIKRNWSVVEDAKDRISASDRAAVKDNIVNIMLVSPEAIQKQLSDAISIIGKYDFPAKWPNLISQMVEKFQTGDFHVINGVLHTAHSIFKRYRYEFKSQVLWTEIKIVLDNFARPLTELFVNTMNLTTTHANNPEALKVIYGSLVVICKVFYSLNYQDLPEFFEDNLETWMSHFHTLLTADVKCLETSDDEEVGVLEQLKSQLCENVGLYAQKYDEEFQPFLPRFVTDIWNLLLTKGQQPKYDALVSNALQFLATVADRPHYRDLFEEASVLASICEKVVIPNMEFRVSDEELFEDNPDEYIRRDIDGSDVDTRRRAACDLVRVLSKYFEERMMQIFGQYVQAMLQKYSDNPAENWRSKDAALYLVTSLAAKGQTERAGVTQTSQLVNLTDFSGQHIIPELDKPNVDVLPVIRADALKYMMIFRTILPREVIVSCLPKFASHLTAKSHVVHSYAACAIEKVLAMRDPKSQPIVKKEEVSVIGASLLNSLFTALTIPGSEENEYVMKAIMRTFAALQEGVIPFLELLLPKLTEKLNIVSKNPSRPQFNHYLFETIGLSIRIVCKTNPEAVASFEAVLFPTFQGILSQDVQEFIPYVFQLLSLLLELRPVGNVSEPYLVLFPCLLAPVLWERPGNIRPLVRLLQAYVRKGSAQIIESQKLDGLLGIFQKLIASKANDHDGFHLIQDLMEHMPAEVLSQYLRRIFYVLFQRLQSSKTTKFVKGLLVFFCFYAIKYGAPNLIEMIDGIQAQMFGMVLERLLIADMQKISGAVERKIAAVGVTRLLCDSPALISGPYARYWLVNFSFFLDGIAIWSTPNNPQILNNCEYFAPQNSMEHPEICGSSSKIYDTSMDFCGAESSTLNCMGFSTLDEFWEDLFFRPSLTQALVSLFELPEDESTLPDDHYIEVDDTPGYNAGYSQLSFSNDGGADPLQGVGDPRLYLAENLAKLVSTNPGQVAVIANLLEPQRTYLKKYLDAAGVVLQ